MRNTVTRLLGPAGQDSVCHVRVYWPGDHVIMVLSELNYNPGVAVTNAAEIIRARCGRWKAGHRSTR